MLASSMCGFRFYKNHPNMTAQVSNDIVLYVNAYSQRLKRVFFSGLNAVKPFDLAILIEFVVMFRINKFKNISLDYAKTLN